MAQVVVVATRYDQATRITHRWADGLVRALSLGVHTPIFIPGSAVSAATFSQTISTCSTSDFVIFYGHGEAHRLIGQLGWLSVGSGPTLVDDTTVNVFKGLPVYAVCCHALGTLGSAYASAYPQGAFIGYETRFGFSIYDDSLFQRIVNDAALDFVNGNPPAQIIANLKNNWQTLSDDFLNGSVVLPICQAAVN
jgi:hypothetical protein